MLGLVYTLAQGLCFPSLTHKLIRWLVWRELRFCVNPVATWSQQIGCCENECINRRWGEHISFLWAPQILICIFVYLPHSEPWLWTFKDFTGFSYSYSGSYYGIGNIFCFQFFANSLHLFCNLPCSIKRSTPISGLPFMIISICTARQILYFSLPIHWSTNLF